MQGIFDIMITMPLFDDVNEENYIDILNWLNYEEKSFSKNEVIYSMKDGIRAAGIVLSGKVNITFFNESGLEHNMCRFEKGMIFGEALACFPDKNDIIQVTSVTESRVLFLELTELFTEEAKRCHYASQVSVNLLKDIARKNIFLSKKTQILVQKKIRNKIRLYLKSIAGGNDSINLPFNRQEMANYLSVDRSALSRELGNMRDDGIISFNKNQIFIMNKSFIE